MEIGNVLVIGNSGVGKSTLINAVLGEESAETGWGIEGTTIELKPYKNEGIPFRLIDTVGFAPGFIKETQAINVVKKWSKSSMKEGNSDKQINVIWFCVDGSSSKLFLHTLNNLSRATSVWKTVPIIVVITKSFSEPNRTANIEMVNEAFSKRKHLFEKLRKVIPVVASTFVLNDNAFAPPSGITELIDATNELMPEGMKAGKDDIATFNLKRKRALAHGVVGVSTASAVVIGAVPVPFADAFLLTPLEIAEVNALAQIYGINKTEGSKQFINSIVEVGTVSLAAKAAISALKAIPGINIGASVLNAVIAGSIVTAIGEGTIYAFEQIYLGKKSVLDIDWVSKLLEAKLTSQLTDKVKTILEEIAQNPDKKNIPNIIINAFKK